MTVYCARDFSADDIETIRALMRQNPALQRSPLSRQLCELWDWRKPNGELKDMTCRVALLRLQAAGLIELAPSKFVNARKRPEFCLRQPLTLSARLRHPCMSSGR